MKLGSTSHTAGPWQVMNRSEICACDSKQSLIAEVFEDSANWRVNAHLIAAAPDMLRMLRTASAAYGERLSAVRDERAWRGDDEYRDMVGNYRHLKLKTDAVIAKAKSGK